MKTIKKIAGSNKLHPFFLVFLWVAIVIYAITFFRTFNSNVYPAIKIVNSVYCTLMIIGLCLMTQAKKIGYYLCIGLWIILGIGMSIFYFTNGHHSILFRGTILTPMQSAFATIAGVVIWIFLLKVFMQIKKDGKDAYEIMFGNE